MSNSIVELESLPPAARTHSAPNLTKLGLTGQYAPSPCGTDTNLLILLHGLGDTEAPFYKLGLTLNLPQSATLSLRGISQVPLLEEAAFQWFHSFDESGELIQNPNPTSTLKYLRSLIDHLTSTSPTDPAWSISDIHLFGFAQGGTAAAELVLELSKSSLTPIQTTSTPLSTMKLEIGSLITISSPLLSFPTLPIKSATKVLALYRKGEERAIPLGPYRKGFSNLSDIVLPSNRNGVCMPSNKFEWDGIMRFWAGVMRQRSALEFGEDVYRVK